MGNDNGKVAWIGGIAVTILVSCFGIVSAAIINNQKQIVRAKEKNHDMELRTIERHEAIMAKLSNIDRRLATVEGNRFTSMDANRLMDTMLKKLPPQWLVDRVDENKKDIEELQRKRR